MGTIEDENCKFDAEDEVKKLQDLVKKLEKQNELLKNNQTADENGTVISNGTTESNLKVNGTLPKKSISDNVKFKNKNKLEDIDLIDLNGTVSDSEDSWLFVSPKSSGSKKISPYKWVRQDLEKRSPEVENIRKSLVFRLDDVTRMVRSPSSGSSVSSFRQTAASHEEETPRARRAMPGLDKRAFTNGTDYRPEMDEDVRNVNTNTFRIKKRPAVPSLARTNLSSSSSQSRDSPLTSPRDVTPPPPQVDPAERVRELHSLLLDTRNANSTEARMGGSTEARMGGEARLGGGEAMSMSRQSSSDDNSLEGEYNKLSDVTDVQVLARMQEDSLRQSMCSPAQFNQKKGLSRSMNSGYGSNRSSPARNTENTYAYESRRTDPRSGSLSSQDSTSESPYSSNPQLDDDETDALRRSMPNLNKTATMSLPSHPSDPDLHDTAPSGGGPIHTGTFTRRKPGRGGGTATMSRYGSGGLGARSPSGLSYARTQSPASRSPQRAYNPPPLRPTQARNVSPMETADSPPVRRRMARNVSPIDDTPDSPPIRRRMPAGASANGGGGIVQVRNVSPVRAYQARNVSPVSTQRVPQPRGLRAPQTGSSTHARTRSPGQRTTPMPRAYSGSALQPPSQYSARTASPQNRPGTSPNRSGLPTPRTSAISRTGTGSKLPSPRKSTIPAARRAALFNKFSARSGDDSNWKEGCY